MEYNKAYKIVDGKWKFVGYVCPLCNGIKQTLYVINKHYPLKCPKATKTDKIDKINNDTIIDE